MSSTDFTDSSTVILAAWLDDVDVATYASLSSVAGTNTITATGPVPMSAYASGQLFRFIPAGTNTGATTINITPSGGSALGAKNIFSGGAACVGGEIVSAVPIAIMYDGTQFNIIGGLTKTGDIDLSTGSLRGIKFDATQNASSDANTLDDYEEGSFTPTLIGSSTPGTQTYVAQVGRYIKIGKMVHINGYVEISGKDGAIAGNIQLGGLPVASENTTSLFNAITLSDTFGLTYGASRTWVSGSLAPNVSVVNIQSQGSGVATASITVADTAASAGFGFTGFYRAAS